jgi:hypothetical protein
VWVRVRVGIFYPTTTLTLAVGFVGFRPISDLLGCMVNNIPEGRTCVGVMTSAKHLDV